MRRTFSKTCRSRSRPKSCEQLPPPERGAVERILHYPEESAGRRMQTEFIAVPPTWTVGHAIDHMRETADLPDRFFELYVVDEGRKLLGAVALDRLLRTKRPVRVAELMDPDRRRVRATDDQEEVARMFERYNLVAAPVVDDGERLVGVLTHDDDRRRHRGGGRRGHPGARRRHPATKNWRIRSGTSPRAASTGC